jgi:hypothetical protein
MVLHKLLTALEAFENLPDALFEALPVRIEQLTPG